MQIPFARSRAVRCARVLAWLMAVAVATTAAAQDGQPHEKAVTGSCTRAAGPGDIVPARWADAAKARDVLTKPGFAVLEVLTSNGNRLRVHIYRPSRFDPSSDRLWFVMHGTNRDADRYIDVAAPVAELHQVLAIAIEFSRDRYPSGADYTLGGLATGPAESTSGMGHGLVPNETIYLEIERVFEAVRTALAGRQLGYYLFGHSAGAQFTHRLLTFVPCARVLRAVAANAGWYTLPTADAGQHRFPYSLRGAPPGAANQQSLLAAPLTLLLGANDTRDGHEDRNVRSTAAAMGQGANRLARGRHYYESGQRLAASLRVPFGWKLHLVPGAGHDAAQMIASAGHLLFGEGGLCEPSAPDDAKNLVLEEILADPPFGMQGDTNGDGVLRSRDEQFVEMVNVGPRPLCVTGWMLEIKGAQGGHLFPLGPALAPGRALLVFGGGVPTGRFGDSDVQRATSQGGLGLQTESGTITLRDALGQVALRMSWGRRGTADSGSDHWPGSLPLRSSLVRVPGPQGQWRIHGEVSLKPISPGSRIDGSPW